MSASVASIDPYNEDSASPLTATKPAGFAAGQLLVFVHSQDSGTIASFTAPSGWFSPTGGTWDVGGGGVENSKVWYHVFDGTEGATFDFGYGAGADTTAHMVRVAGADTTPVITAIGSPTASMPSSFDSSSITPAGSDDLLICTLANQCGGTVLTETDPSGMTDGGQTQVAGNFQAQAIATLQLSSGSATGAKTWTSITPINGAGGSFSIVIKSAGASLVVAEPARLIMPLYFLHGLLAARSNLVTVPDPPLPATDPVPPIPGLPPDLLVLLLASRAAMAAVASTLVVTSDVGTSYAGVTATAVARKVAPVAGICSAGATALATDRKVAPQTATAPAGAVALATERKVAPQTATAPAGAVALATERKVAPQTATAPAGAVALVTDRKVTPQGARAPAGAVALATERKVAPQTGLLAGGASTWWNLSNVRPQTGLLAAGAVAYGVAGRRVAGNGRSSIGAVAYATISHAVTALPAYGIDGELGASLLVDDRTTGPTTDERLSGQDTSARTSGGTTDGRTVQTGGI